MRPPKIVLTVRCTREEADRIRLEAQRQHRSITSLIVHATLEHITQIEIRRIPGGKMPAR